MEKSISSLKVHPNGKRRFGPEGGGPHAMALLSSLIADSPAAFAGLAPVHYDGPTALAS